MVRTEVIPITPHAEERRSIYLWKERRIRKSLLVKIGSTLSTHGRMDCREGNGCIDIQTSRKRRAVVVQSKVWLRWLLPNPAVQRAWVFPPLPADNWEITVAWLHLLQWCGGWFRTFFYYRRRVEWHYTQTFSNSFKALGFGQMALCLKKRRVYLSKSKTICDFEYN